MKTLWLDDQKLVDEEIDRLIQQKAPLFCLRKDKKEVTKLRATGTTSPKSGKMLVLNHPHEPSCNKPTCLFYYHLANKPLRLFECQRVKKIDQCLGLRLPEKIFELQRRRYQRVRTPHNSSATFSFERKQRVYHGTVEDISAGGAKVRTDIPLIIPKDASLSPLTLTLFLRFRSDKETLLTIPGATVKWTTVEGERTLTMGLHFSLQDSILAAMTDYVDLRTIEDASAHP